MIPLVSNTRRKKSDGWFVLPTNEPTKRASTIGMIVSGLLLRVLSTGIPTMKAFSTDEDLSNEYNP